MKKLKQKLLACTMLSTILIGSFLPMTKVNAEGLEIESLDYLFSNNYEGYEDDLNEYVTTYLDKETTLENIKSSFDIFYEYYLTTYVGEDEYYKTYHEELDDLYYEVIYNILINENFEFDGSFEILANKDSDTPLHTTYEGLGYHTQLQFNNEVYGVLEEYSLIGYIKARQDGYTLEKLNTFSLDVSLKKKNNTTVVATYKLTNTSDKEVPFKLASYGDTELGGNDRSAISKTDKELTITQDAKKTTDSVGNPVDVEYSYGAQFNILLNTSPSTIFIGPYANETYDGDFYYNKVFETSDKTYYTVDDGIDSALAYSWQGTIAPGETKTYTVTFTIKKSDAITLNFYHFGSDIPTPDSPISTIGGGAFKTPASSLTQEEGYNIKWYPSKDGNGIGYYPDTWSLAPNESTDFYEIKKSNTVVKYEDKENVNYLNAEVVITSDLVNEFKSEAAASYDDIKIILEVDKLDPNTIGEDKDKIDTGLTEGFKIGTYFDADLFKLVNNETREAITNTNKPVKIMIEVPEELINKDKNIIRSYELLRLHDGEVESIPGEFDTENNKLTFESNKFSLYAIAYKDEEKPQIDNPKTGDKISLYITIGLISLIGLSATLFIKKEN